MQSDKLQVTLHFLWITGENEEGVGWKRANILDFASTTYKLLQVL